MCSLRQTIQYKATNFIKARQTFYNIVALASSIFKGKKSLWSLLITGLTDIQLTLKISSIMMPTLAFKISL